MYDDEKDPVETPPVAESTPQPDAETAAKKPAAKPKKAATPPKAATPKAEPAKLEVTVLLKDIILPDDWNREKPVNIAALAQSIKEIGLLTPLTVRPSTDKPGKVILTDGRRRYAALQEAGITRAPVYVKAGIEDDLKAFLASLAANLNREPNTDYEIAIAMRKLADAGMKQKDIARVCGQQSDGYVSQHISTTKAPAAAVEGFRKGKISFSKMRVFARLNEEEDAAHIEKILAMALDPTKTTEDMTNSVEMYLTRKKKKEGAKKKKGSAAATKAEKKRGPAPKLTDYNEPGVRKLISIISAKDDAVELLNYAQTHRLKSSSKNRMSYYDGMLDGMELFSRLKVLE